MSDIAEAWARHQDGIEKAVENFHAKIGEVIGGLATRMHLELHQSQERLVEVLQSTHATWERHRSENWNSRAEQVLRRAVLAAEVVSLFWWFRLLVGGG